MNEVFTLLLPMAIGISLTYSVRRRQARKWLGIILLLGSPIALFQLPVVPDGLIYVYVAAWWTGLDLFCGRDRYVRED